MKTKALVSLFLVFSIADVFAQADSTSTPKQRIVYCNTFLAGGLLGEEGEGGSLTFSTTHGIRYKQWVAGIGVGYDAYYDWNILPLYGSLTMDLNRNSRYGYYVQLNAGYAMASWMPEREEDYLPDINSNGGRMINPMLGFSIKAEHYRLYMSAGYKFQRISYSYLFSYPSSQLSVREEMERFVVQIGFGFH